MKIIILSGKAGSGKDTVASIFKMAAEADGKKVLTIAFADQLKVVCERYFDYKGVKDEKDRNILQEVGDIVRNNWKNYFAFVAVDLVMALRTEFDYAILTDARYENEIEYAKTVAKRVDIPVLVARVKSDRESKLTKGQQKHVSETSLDDYEFDWHVNNTRDMIFLLGEVKKLYEKIEEVQHNEKEKVHKRQR